MAVTGRSSLSGLLYGIKVCSCRQNRPFEKECAPVAGQTGEQSRGGSGKGSKHRADLLQALSSLVLPPDSKQGPNVVLFLV